MATSAFKSTTKRTPIVKTPSTSSSAAVADSPSSSSSSFARRSRSLSRFSRPRPPAYEDFSDDSAAPPPPSLRRARFVNTVRGSSDMFPEITLDDLAISFFGSADRPSRRSDAGERTVSLSQRRGRSVSRHSSLGGSGAGGYRGGTENSDASSRRSEFGERTVAASQRRGRSVSRHSIGGGGGVRSCNGKTANSDANSRRRRSVSVVRYQISDSEVLHFWRSLHQTSIPFRILALNLYYENSEMSGVLLVNATYDQLNGGSNRFAFWLH